MRIGGDKVGARGLALLGVAALAGIGLGVHGWSGRHNGVAPALAGSGPAVSATASPPGPSSAPSQGPVASSPPASSAPPTKAKTGPKLSAQSYASYAFQVWPGPVGQAGKAAETGLVIKVTRSGQGIKVAAGVAGQKMPAATLYATGAKVYVIEASMGDDSGSDFNLGDDGLVVTDSQGRIVQ